MVQSSYHSFIGKELQGFIDYKRAMGYKYDCEAYIAHRFDDYWEKTNGCETRITRESLLGWMERLPGEGVSSRSMRISVVRQFALYLNGIGKEAYIPPDKYIKERPVIHILSSEELQALFRSIDEYEPRRFPTFSIRMRAEYKVLFRLILTTGLRRGEAAGIRVNDIDWKERTITIYNGKGNKDRLVYMSADMTDLLRDYVEYLFSFVRRETEWLFPSFCIDDHVSAAALAITFKRYWKMTPFSRSCEKDPTIHSLRHTYVVFRMNMWIAQGVDVNLMLPYLSRQLGHKSPDETFYYYHQVKDSFRIIQEKDSLSPDIFSEVRVR